MIYSLVTDPAALEIPMRAAEFEISKQGTTCGGQADGYVIGMS